MREKKSEKIKKVLGKYNYWRRALRLPSRPKRRRDGELGSNCQLACHSKLIDIFLNSKQLNIYRDLKLYKKCESCPLLYTCRGCGAIAYGNSGSFFDPDPQCWYNE